MFMNLMFISLSFCWYPGLVYCFPKFDCVLQEEDLWNLHLTGIERPCTYFAYYSDFTSICYLFGLIKKMVK